MISFIKIRAAFSTGRRGCDDPKRNNLKESESMNQRLISVIVAAFNVDKYLNRCIQSIVEQTYPDLEIILVDDGSTDRTGAICDDWANKDNRIIIIHKKNGGLSDARNTGIQRACGKWLGFVDADDYISANMYERLYQYRTEKGMTVCGFLIENNGNLQQCPGIKKTLQPREAVDLFIANELQGITYWGAYAWNKLYDRCLFENISYPEGKTYEDACIILDLVHQAESITFIPDCEYIYVQRPDSITHDNSNIISDLLSARLRQKEQLLKYWQMSDNRIEKLLALEYFSFLCRYACLSPKERDKYQEDAVKAWQMLKQSGYSHFPMKMKMRLFMYVCCPSLQFFMRKMKLIIKG